MYVCMCVCACVCTYVYVYVYVYTDITNSTIHHHISVMELGHLLTRSGLTYTEVSSKVCHDSFCQLGNRNSTILYF